MTYYDEDLKLAKDQAREIWKILDYVRGASPILGKIGPGTGHHFLVQLAPI